MASKDRFAGKVVWVTGASSGIGEALALAFAQAGARLVLSARREAELRRVAARCGAAEVFIVPLDLSVSDDFPRLVERVLERFGRIDIVVQNGGISQRSLVEDTAMDVHRRIMEVDYFGTVALTRAVLPTLLSQRSGHFVVITSVMAKVGTPLRSSYAGAKHALHGFFDCLRAETAADGVSVSLIMPGYVATDVSRNALTAEGEPTGKDEATTANGATPAETAAQILSAVARKRSEVYVGRWGKDRLALTLKRFLPALLERMVQRSSR
ncbi:SDR family oxidoreductase [Corallococcus sp. Z5C101001]|uniref:SDR family oxidoreductase n=1 Tax=Corallococcus sp. Z5C101001 TaxID=2596829 RepID=UPI00117F852A|nr:SDR family oxidoreductase [Corallococcus sp. Z5C101001]TSC31178.1 SDR family oxidoreductase [Corallococcus sp. Z5C101001]